MKQMIKYELKKILNRKANIIAMVLGILLVFISNIAMINGESLYLGNENTISGVAAIQMQADIENGLTDVLSEDFLTEFLSEYQMAIQNNPDGYDYSLIAPKSNLFGLIGGNYAEFNEDYGFEDLLHINTDDRIDFYERRLEKVRTLLNADYSYGNYTEAERAYWLQKAESVKIPFEWGNRNTWDIIWNSIVFVFYQFFVVSICLAPVFSGEYQNRTDALILSSKHGKNKIICAKILAALTFALTYIVLCSILSSGICIAILGVDGWNLPVQLWNSIIPYQMSVIEACGLNMLLMLLIAVLLTAVTLMLSTVCKSQLTALAIDILIFFGAVFLPSSKTSGLWNRIVRLFPINAFNLKEVLKAYSSYPFGNVVISYLMMMVITYSIIIVICLCYARVSFKKHQITS